MLTEFQKNALLKIARCSIARRWRPEPAPDEAARILDELEKQHAGIFVSLHVGGQLRGCIGNVEGLKPLPELVAEMAQAAAFHDPRFVPLDPEELDRVTIEISLLSSLQRVHSPEEIEIGRHGLLVKRGKHHGLLLPQVATSRGWEAQTFLKHVCHKAHLPEQAWQQPETELFTFSAQVFSEGWRREI